MLKKLTKKIIIPLYKKIIIQKNHYTKNHYTKNHYTKNHYTKNNKLYQKNFQSL
jgi:hypothetical protein